MGPANRVRASHQGHLAIPGALLGKKEKGYGFPAQRSAHTDLVDPFARASEYADCLDREFPRQSLVRRRSGEPDLSIAAFAFRCFWSGDHRIATAADCFSCRQLARESAYP